MQILSEILTFLPSQFQIIEISNVQQQISFFFLFVQIERITDSLIRWRYVLFSLYDALHNISGQN